MPAPDRQAEPKAVAPPRVPVDWQRRVRAWFASRRERAANATQQPIGDGALPKGAMADLDDLRYAYRLLLGREPDPSGFASHARRLKSGTLTPTALAESFVGSGEYVERHMLATTPVEVRLDGYSVFVRPIDHDVGQSIRETKSYEPHVTAVVREVLRPGDAFVDVGANVGFFTAMAAHIVGAGGKVFAIEPMDKNVQLISAAVWRNAFAHVEIFPYAASDHEALLPIASGPGTSNAQIVLAEAGAPLPAIFALARRMDDMLRHVETIDLLKIDVEGHELLALRGFSDGLARCRPRLLTEFHPRCMRDNAGIDPADYLEFLFAYGDRIDVLHVDGERVTCGGAADVLNEWEKADKRLNSGGTTHLDLFVEPRERG
jgi:FkbM family methyltransferase